jgi:hypothetical protein
MNFINFLLLKKIEIGKLKKQLDFIFVDFYLVKNNNPKI